MFIFRYPKLWFWNKLVSCHVIGPSLHIWFLTNYCVRTTVVRTVLLSMALCWILRSAYVCHEVSINPFVALFMAARFKCVWRHPQLRLPTTATGETQSWRPNASNYWFVIVRSCTFGASLSGLALSTSAIWSVIVSQVRHFQRPHSVNNIQCESKKLSPEVLWNFSLQRTQRSDK